MNDDTEHLCFDTRPQRDPYPYFDPSQHPRFVEVKVQCPRPQTEGPLSDEAAREGQQ